MLRLTLGSLGSGGAVWMFSGRFCVSLVWVPPHSHIPGNFMAYEFARAGAPLIEPSIWCCHLLLPQGENSLGMSTYSGSMKNHAALPHHTHFDLRWIEGAPISCLDFIAMTSRSQRPGYSIMGRTADHFLCQYPSFTRCKFTFFGSPFLDIKNIASLFKLFA